MHPWVTQVTNELPKLANSDNAAAMKSYMRGQFEFYGIQSGPRRDALKVLFSKESIPSIEDIPQVVNELWQLPQREYQMVAVDLLIKVKNKLPLSTTPHLETWITSKSWWDTVDMLATHIAGVLFLNFPNEFAITLENWKSQNNIWLRRTTILYQLKYKSKTNEAELLNTIKLNKDDNEFFIQKAIGWSLREYSKTAPNQVVQFIAEQNIQGLAKREGLKWLINKGLMTK